MLVGSAWVDRFRSPPDARALFEIAQALRDLLYALKHSNEGGLSVAEAIEVSGKGVAEAVQSVATVLEGREG